MDTTPAHSDDSIVIHVTCDPAFAQEVAAADLRRAARAALVATGAPAGELTIVVTDDDEVRSLNRQYRQVDAPTDVLSFGGDTEVGAEPAGALPPELAAELAGYLGDLVIGFPYSKAQAARAGHPLDAELRLLVVHGTLHLMGLDHGTAEEEQAMWQIQREILDRLGDEGITWDAGHAS